ncbi:MAG: hypothetical protein ACYDDV_07645 [Methanoregula sp.]
MANSNKDKNDNSLSFYQRYKKELVLLIITAIISGLISVIFSIVLFNYQFSTTTLTERKNLANGYLSDIENVNGSLGGFITEYSIPTITKVKPMSKWGNSFYPEWGLYYSNRQDISKFDPELSKDLYEFYYILLNAEFCRQEFNNYDQTHPKDPDQPIEQYKQNSGENKEKLFNNMNNLVVECYTIRIPNLITKLKSVANS